MNKTRDQFFKKEQFVSSTTTRRDREKLHKRNLHVPKKRKNHIPVTKRDKLTHWSTLFLRMSLWSHMPWATTFTMDFKLKDWHFRPDWIIKENPMRIDFKLILYIFMLKTPNQNSNKQAKSQKKHNKKFHHSNYYLNISF